MSAAARSVPSTIRTLDHFAYALAIVSEFLDDALNLGRVLFEVRFGEIEEHEVVEPIEVAGNLTSFLEVERASVR